MSTYNRIEKIGSNRQQEARSTIMGRKEEKMRRRRWKKEEAS
jgi:hypothetical protein